MRSLYTRPPNVVAEGGGGLCWMSSRSTGNARQGENTRRVCSKKDSQPDWGQSGGTRRLRDSDGRVRESGHVHLPSRPRIHLQVDTPPCYSGPIPVRERDSVCVCLFVSVCVREREREREGGVCVCLSLRRMARRVSRSAVTAKLEFGDGLVREAGYVHPPPRPRVHLQVAGIWS